MSTFPGRFAGKAGVVTGAAQGIGAGVARRLAAHEVESPLMPLDETISIMETMDTVLAQARRDA